MDSHLSGAEERTYQRVFEHPTPHDIPLQEGWSMLGAIADVRAVEERPEDRVMCRRIWGNSYRCNWWSAADSSQYDNPGMKGNLVTTHTIRKSRFLNVTRSRTGLVIIEQNGQASN